MRQMLMAAAACLAWCANAHAFECQSARLPAEIVLCSDSGLLQLYKERQRAYGDAHSRLPAEQAGALASEERRWIRRYARACGLRSAAPQPVPADMQACFKRANQERIAYLHAYRPAVAPAPPDRTAGAEPMPTPPSKTPSGGIALPAGKPTPVEATAPATAGKSERQPAAIAAPIRKAPPDKADTTPPAPAKNEVQSAAVGPRQTGNPGLPGKIETPSAPSLSDRTQTTALPVDQSAAPPIGALPIPEIAPGQTRRMKFTFGCQNSAKVPAVIQAYARHDYGFVTSQYDCFPISDNTPVKVLSLAGTVAKVRLCSAVTGDCTEVYVDTHQME